MIKKIHVAELRRRKACKSVCQELEEIFGKVIVPSYDNFLIAQEKGFSTYDLCSYIGLGKGAYIILQIEDEIYKWCVEMGKNICKKDKKWKKIHWEELEAFVAWYTWTYYTQNLLPEEQ